MTERQKEIYEAIKEYIEENKISPTVRELCKITGSKSTSTVHSILDRLQDKGYISKRKDSPRSIAIVGEDYKSGKM